MSHPLKEYLTETGDTLTAFAARIGVSRSALSRIVSGQRAPSPGIARRIVEATGGAITLDALFGGEAGAVADLAQRRPEEEAVDAALLASVLRHVLGNLVARDAALPSEPLLQAAAEAVINTHSALARVTTRRGQDRLVQALRPVLEEILKDCPELRLPGERLEEASRQAAALYFEARSRLQAK